MNTKTLGIVAGLLLLLVSLPCLAQEKGQAKQSEKETLVRQAAVQLRSSLEAGELDRAFEIMNPTAFSEFAADRILTCIAISRETGAGKDFASAATELVKKYELDKAKLPEQYFSAMENGEWPSDTVMKQALAAALTAVPEAKRKDAAKEIHSKLGAEIGLAIFEGSVTEVVMNSEATAATVKMELSKAELEQLAEEFEAEGENISVAQLVVPPTFHRFVEVNGDWKYDGADKEKTQQAMEQAGAFEEDTELMKESPQIQPQESRSDDLSDQLKKLGYQSIELQQMISGHLVANAVVNKEHRLRMVVDSGSGATLVTPEIAKRLQLDSKDSGETAGGVGGSGMAVGEGELEHFQLGSFAADAMPIAVIDISHVNDQFNAIGEKPVEGIIGSDWLAEQGALIDVKGLRLFVKTGEK